MKAFNRKKISDVSKNRMTYLFGIVGFLFLLLIAGLFYRTVVQGNELTKQALDVQNVNRNILPRRGTIFDRNNTALAISSKVYIVSINPKKIIENNKLSPLEITEGISNILKVDRAKLLSKITIDQKYYLVKRKVEEKEKVDLDKWIKKEKIDGIYYSDDYKRYYPDGKFAAQVLGFLATDNQGLYGVENTFEDDLKGTAGKNVSEVMDGNNIHLTIDETIQYFAEKALDKAILDNKVMGGAIAIVTDPKNGDILALVSKPDFDPNDPYLAPKISGIDISKWGNGHSNESVGQLSSTVWRNKAISDTYEPGSTFKSITSCAGIEEGLVTANTIVNDKTIQVDKYHINCWKKAYGGIHGSETFAKALYNSCNPVFSLLSQQLGIDKFYKYIESFGFDKCTGILLPGESKGIEHDKPDFVDMNVAAFGQRFNVTPIQLIMSYGAIANGGILFEPRIVSQVTDSKGNLVRTIKPTQVRRVISESTSKTIRDILTGVVDEGTGAKAYVDGYNVAGKTGTSQTVNTLQYDASFAGFAPADNPRICVLVVMKNPQGVSHKGGIVAAPVASKIIEDTLTYLKVERKFDKK
ncbi:MAG: penicillin-binding transpeptidase domain-containing protein [Bacillota bacterium]